MTYQKEQNIAGQNNQIQVNQEVRQEKVLITYPDKSTEEVDSNSRSNATKR